MRIVNRRELERDYNKIRWKVLRGHGITYIIDVINNKAYEYENEKTIIFPDKYGHKSASDYIDDVLEPNGWKHWQSIEDSLNEFAEVGKVSEIEITPAARKHFIEGMEQHERCFRSKGLTCNVGYGEKIDDVGKDGCEVAHIGRNYTWHTHTCGVTPSDVDIMTTEKLGKRYLCIGHSPSKKSVCYDMQNGGKVAGYF